MNERRAFGILRSDNYSLGSKITTWLMSEIESIFENRDLGLTWNTGPYRTSSQSCGWRRPSGFWMRCHKDALTRDLVIIDTVSEDWHYKRSDWMNACKDLLVPVTLTIADSLLYLRTVTSGISPPTLLPPSLTTSTGSLSRTKGTRGRTAILCHKSLSRPSATACVPVPDCSAST